MLNSQRVIPGTFAVHFAPKTEIYRCHWLREKIEPKPLLVGGERQGSSVNFPTNPMKMKTSWNSSEKMMERNRKG